MSFIELQKGSGQQPETLVFLPGWGFDGRVGRYGAWPPGVEVLAPSHFCHARLVAELGNYLAQRQVAKVALCGWSMGANLAWQFAGMYPEQVSSLVLMAGRRHWPSAEIAAIKADLDSDVRKSMQGFYRKCFLGHKKLYGCFVEELEADYLAGLDRHELLAGLDYLGAHPLSGQAPEGVAVHVVHGRKDVVAPLAERPQIAGAVDRVVDGGGHLIFAHRHAELL